MSQAKYFCRDLLPGAKGGCSLSVANATVVCSGAAKS